MPTAPEPSRCASVLIGRCRGRPRFQPSQKSGRRAPALLRGMKRGAHRPVDSRMISPRGTGVAVLNVIYAHSANRAIKQCFRVDPRCSGSKGQEALCCLPLTLEGIPKRVNSFLVEKKRQAATVLPGGLLLHGVARPSME